MLRPRTNHPNTNRIQRLILAAVLLLASALPFTAHA